MIQSDDDSEYTYTDDDDSDDSDRKVEREIDLNQVSHEASRALAAWEATVTLDQSDDSDGLRVDSPEPAKTDVKTLVNGINGIKGLERQETEDTHASSSSLSGPPSLPTEDRNTPSPRMGWDRNVEWKPSVAAEGNWLQKIENSQEYEEELREELDSPRARTPERQRQQADLSETGRDPDAVRRASQVSLGDSLLGEPTQFTPPVRRQNSFERFKERAANKLNIQNKFGGKKTTMRANPEALNRARMHKV